MSSTERKQQIGKLIGDAMKSARGVDWTRENPAITKAQADLEELMTQYCEGTATKTVVRSAYHKWRDPHKTGGTR